MLNDAAAVDDDRMNVLEGIQLQGAVNTTDDVILENIRASIRRGHAQVKPHPDQGDRVVLVGGGPSLESTLPELRDLIFDGAKLVTVNGAYRWCIEHNLQPKTQIVMDARASNARFVDPPVPYCNYLFASQCHPALWDAVQGRDRVLIFHAATGDDPRVKQLLDDYYLGQWIGIGGGTTVMTRAVWLMRTFGYLRYDLFGVDCCWMDGAHHAYDQPENSRDKRIPFRVRAAGRDEPSRVFRCAPWHVKQVEDFLQEIRINSTRFMLNVHGDGLLAYVLRDLADDLTLEQIGEPAGQEPA